MQYFCPKRSIPVHSWLVVRVRLGDRGVDSVSRKWLRPKDKFWIRSGLRLHRIDRVDRLDLSLESSALHNV